MIGFRNQEDIIKAIVDDLVDLEYARSWNIALPPGFGEDVVIGAVVDRIQQAEARPLLADVTSDSVPNVVGYIQSLHRQWNEFHRLPPLPMNLGPSEMFDALLAALPDDRPVVQVIRRFHKVLDCLDVWFLGKLRDAEQHKKLRTFTATPVSLDELKLRWETEGHILVVSDYGDTHVQGVVQVLDEDAVVSAAEAMDIPPGVAGHLFALTGGYPEPFDTVAKQWFRSGRPQLRPDVRKGLRSAATKSFSRFVKWLDCKGRVLYRDSVIDLYQGFEAEIAYQRLAAHPWRNILFDDEFGLRAECVGEAAVLDAVRSAAVGGEPEHVGLEMERRARQMYGRKQYEAALAVFENIAFVKPVRPDLAVLHANMRVMRTLYQGDSPGEDTDWRVVLREVKAAYATLEAQERKIENTEFLAARLAELQETAERLVNVQTGNDVRLVDVLCGLRSTDNCHPKIAALLLLLKYESCIAIPGHASACQAALYLPEQIFRLWAFWCLEINYYHSPENSETIWNDAESKWPIERRGQLARPTPGESFPSLLSFAYFALAKLLRDEPENLNNAPVPDFPSLERAFSQYERLRNPKAHSYCCTGSKDRKAFFALIDEWLDCLLSVCPEPVTRSELLGMIEPLPVVDREGALVFD